MRWTSIILLAFVVAGSTAISQTKSPASAHMSFELNSPVFASGAAIPREYTCQGSDESPELKWGQPPQGTVAFAVVMHDPDAPVGDWVHWVAWDIPSNSHGLPARVSRDGQFADGTRQGRNSSGKIGYNGPCPPPGKTHRYFFLVYAVDKKLDLPVGATRTELDSALKGHILAEAEYMGTYRR